jgi:catechol 2,3-dioxygenase
MSTTSETTIDIEGRSPDDVIPPRELHHVTFKTNRLDEMVRFYATLTGHRPMFHGDAFAAITFDNANHRIALLKFDGWPELPPEEVAGAAGLDHVGYEYRSLDELLHTYLRVKRRGLQPEWTVNHGPTLSFYYRDPDGHAVELQADNCGHDLERWKAIINGPFQRNQMGINVDADKLVAARARGVSQEQIAADSYKTHDNPYAAPGFGPPGHNLEPPE